MVGVVCGNGIECLFHLLAVVSTSGLQLCVPEPLANQLRLEAYQLATCPNVCASCCRHGCVYGVVEQQGGAGGAGADSRHTFDLVMANILRGPLLELQPRLTDYCKPGSGRLVLSGILQEQV